MNPKSIVTCCLCVIFLFSCNHSTQKATIKANAKSANVENKISHKKANDTLGIPDDTIPKITIPDSAIQVGEAQVDSAYQAKIVYEGSYNAQDSVGPKDAKLDWKGIFYNKGNYYIKPTKIRFKREHSEFDDDDKPEQKTGWFLKCSGKDSCMNLISGVDNLVAGAIKKVELANFYYAGQKQDFTYERVTYTLYSTGTKRNGEVYNFKLFLMAKIKGHIYNQLLKSFGNDVVLGQRGGENHYFVDLELVGDIDGDKIPDFIIKEWGYPFEDTYLYLSRPAGNQAIVKLVANLYTSD
jgi:hypothetical protein